MELIYAEALYVCVGSERDRALQNRFPLFNMHALSGRTLLSGLSLELRAT